MSKEEAVYRGRALQLAQFLTTFQSFYPSNEGIQTRGPISVTAIERAIHYRQRLHQHYALQNMLEGEKDGGKSAIEASQASIEKEFSKDDMAVHELLRRFEVWSTRALANHVLPYCAPARNHGSDKLERICCSSLLNLPGAAHFKVLSQLPTTENLPVNEALANAAASFHAKQGNKDHACGLGLPPNAWTWRELLRISTMVGRLPEKQRLAASKSSLTAASPSLIGDRREDLKMSENSQINVADLVALWVRAQRNTSALLHLYHVFQVREAPPEEPEEVERHWRVAGGRRGKVLVLQEEDEEDDDGQDKPVAPPRYVAKFVGNAKGIQKRILPMSKCLDKLIEWAVTNQALFTYRYVREMLSSKNSRKRRRKDADGDVSTNNKRKKRANGNVASNRQRQDGDKVDGDVATNHDGDVVMQGSESSDKANVEGAESNGQGKAKPTESNCQGMVESTRPDNVKSNAPDPTVELLRACQCFIFRWFASRNRKVVSVLFTSKAHQIRLLPYGTLIQQLLDEKVPESVKAYMNKKYHSNDRTLARIDRRLKIGKFDHNFLETIVHLLEALEDCVPEEMKEQVVAASKDFEMLHKAFLGGDKDVKALAELLLGGSFENPAELLLTLPKPWIDRCGACDKDAGENVAFCDSCNKAFHKQGCAADGDELILEETIRFYEPLAKMYSIKVPSDPPVPDYTSGSSLQVEWTRLDITLERKEKPDGTLQNAGLGLCETETTEHLLQRLASGTESASFVASKEALGLLPLAVDHKGSMVIGMANGDSHAGSASGIKIGDVITDVSFPSESEDGSPETFSLEKLTHEERSALLAKQVPSMSLVVQRPAVDLISAGKAWLCSLQQVNAPFAGALKRDSEDGLQRLWRCSGCKEKSQTQSSESRVYAEARLCRSLIRILGMESYSLPFHDEGPGEANDDNTENNSEEKSRHVSLRRLDAMMSHILLTHDSSMSEETRKAKLNSCTNPFYLPTRSVLASSTGGDADRPNIIPRRLDWAPDGIENKPMEVLCMGMDVLIRPPEATEDAFAEDRLALSRQFLRLFCTRCLAKGEESESSGFTLVTRPPWIHDSCDACRARPNASDGVCHSTYCKQLRASLVNLGEFTNKPNDVETPSLLLEEDPRVRDYNKWSSWVGKPFLVLPGDPLLQYVAKALRTSIDHMDRPVVYVVASYLPSQFFDPSKENFPGLSVENGVFHILPVLADYQLKYLLERCDMRRPSLLSADGKNNSWSQVRVLSENGVIQLSPSALEAKLHQTAAIRESIDAAISDFASRDGCFLEGASDLRHVGTDEQTKSKDARCVSPFPFEEIPFLRSDVSTSNGTVNRSMMAEYSLLLESLLHCEVPFTRGMIEALHPSESLDGNVDRGIRCFAPDDDTDVDESNSCGDTVLRASAREQEDLVASPQADVDGTSLSLNGTARQDSDYMRVWDPRAEPEASPVSPEPVTQDLDNDNVDGWDSPEPAIATPALRGRPANTLAQNAGPAQALAARAPATLVPQQARINGTEVDRLHHPSSREQRHHPRTRISGTDGVYYPRNTYFFTKGDLYRPGINGSVLSRVETCFLVEAVIRRCPILGSRLLRPRYDAMVTKNQVEVVSNLLRAKPQSLPRVQQELWDAVLLLDYKRSLRETGPVRYQEGEFCYREPVNILPLDRLTDAYFRIKMSGGAVECPLADRLAACLADLLGADVAERIRGGGPSIEDEMKDSACESDEGPVLTDYPQRIWLNKLVHAQCQVTREGNEQGDATMIGFIKSIGSPDSSSDATGDDILVNVSVVHVTGTGFLPVDGPTVTHPLLASQLQFVRKGSDKACLAEQWGGFHCLSDPFVAETASAYRNGLDSLEQENEEAVQREHDTDGAPDEEMEDREATGMKKLDMLSDLHRETWLNKLVYTTCRTTRHGYGSGSSKLLGVVRELPSDDTSTEAACVKVTVFHVSIAGFLADDALVTQNISPQMLHVVHEGSEEARIAEQWDDFHLLADPFAPATLSQAGHEREEGLSQGEMLPVSPTNSIELTMNDAATLYLKRLSQRKGPVLIGILPDGRAVLWFSCDPRALYVRAFDFDDESSPSRNALQESRKSDQCFFCPWGCTKYAGDGMEGRQLEPLGFSSLSELFEHLEGLHLLDSKEERVEIGGGHERMGEGSTILALSAQITAALCFKIPALSMCLSRKNGGRNKKFVLKQILNLKPEGRGAPRKLNKKIPFHMTDRQEACNLLRLWSRIARLFAVEADGSFRLTDPLLAFGDQGGSSDARAIEAGQLERAANGCANEAGAVAVFDSSATGACNLCGFGPDAAFEAGSGNTAGGNSSRQGCALQCFLPEHVSDSSIVPKKNHGYAGLARALLIRLASSVPLSLRRQAQQQSGPSTKTVLGTDHVLWEEGNYQNWRYLVDKSSDVDSFRQAFVVLLHSCKTDKLPRWWKGVREGWSSTFGIMSLDSFSSLFLHLYAFDAAISTRATETQSRNKENHHVPEELKGLPLDKRMEVVSNWAKDLKYREVKEGHGSECLKCGEGGMLLCCHYCRHVQHALCCYPPITDAASVEVFVCEPCMNDIAVVHGIQTEEL